MPLKIDFKVGGEPPRGSRNSSIGKWDEVYHLIDRLSINGPWASFILPNRKEAQRCQTCCSNYAYEDINGKKTHKDFSIQTTTELLNDDTVKFWLRKIEVVANRNGR